MGSKEVRSTVLTAEEEAIIVAFRRHTLWKQPSGQVERMNRTIKDESWLGKFGQRDKWSFRLSAARMAAEQEKP
jgi:hypothetical protein